MKADFYTKKLALPLPDSFQMKVDKNDGYSKDFPPSRLSATSFSLVVGNQLISRSESVENTRTFYLTQQLQYLTPPIPEIRSFVGTAEDAV